MSWKTINVDVDVDLSDFDTEDLIEELQSRGHSESYSYNEQLLAIWQKRRLGQDYQKELDELIYQELGKVL